MAIRPTRRSTSFTTSAIFNGRAKPISGPLPAVSFTSWQRGVTQQLGAKNGQVVAILSLEARRGILTANATTPYYLGFADLSAGPLVMVIPPRGVQGGISDAWQRTIPGTEFPGTYLILAPGQKAPENVSGYTVRELLTFNIFLGLRLTDADPERAKEALAQLQMYPYAQRANPPKVDILDAGTKAWSGLPPRGMEYWQRVNDVIQTEPVEPRDVFFHAMLRPLGLEKGKPFRPDARQTKILTDAALIGEAMAKANSADRRFAGDRFRPDAHWDFALQLDADNPDAFWNLLDERASWFYEAVGAGRRWRPSALDRHRRTSAHTRTRPGNGWMAATRIAYACRQIRQSSCSGRSRSMTSIRGH